MYKSKSVASKNNLKDDSDFFLSIIRPSIRNKKQIKDPFSTLNRNSSAKLLPVSPSCLRLPCLQGKLTPQSPHKVTSSSCKDLKIITPRCRDLFKINRLKVQKKINLTVPKTPYFKLRRRDPLITSKEYHFSRNRNSDINFEEISFGNNN